MARNQTPFFGTRGDMELYIRSLSQEYSFRFAVAGLFDSATPQIIENLCHNPFFGLSRNGNAATEPRYLVFDPKTTQIRVRAVPQKSGGEKFAVDQIQNPETIVFQPGGVFGGNVLISGQIGTATENSVSLEMYTYAAKVMRDRFAKVRSFMVGEEAAALLEKGWRLTGNVKASEEYDLKR